MSGEIVALTEAERRLARTLERARGVRGFDDGVEALAEAEAAFKAWQRAAGSFVDRLDPERGERTPATTDLVEAISVNELHKATKALKRAKILQALARHCGDKMRAAAALGVSYATLCRLLQDLGIG